MLVVCDQCFVIARSVDLSVPHVSVGRTVQSRGAGSRGSLFLWLSNSHRERPLRDVQFTNRHLYPGSKEKVLPCVSEIYNLLVDHYIWDPKKRH